MPYYAVLQFYTSKCSHIFWIKLWFNSSESKLDFPMWNVVCKLPHSELPGWNSEKTVEWSTRSQGPIRSKFQVLFQVSIDSSWTINSAFYRTQSLPTALKKDFYCILYSCSQIHAIFKEVMITNYLQRFS